MERTVTAIEKVIWPVKRNWLIRDEKESHRSLETLELSQYRVLILLGAAGLGKTFEMKRLESQERETGRRVVNLSLGSAATSGHDLRRRIDQVAEEAGNEGAIYLDSLDEALVPIGTAAGVIESWVKERLATKPILRIACRSAVWPKIVRQALDSVYERTDITVVELQPFGDEAINSILEAEGLDSARFISTPRTSGAFLLAQHPLTLRLLVDELRQSGGLPATRRGLFEKGVRRLCTESPDRRERGTAPEESPDTLIEGAERLAAFAMLSGREVINLGESNLPETGTLQLLELSGLPSARGPVLDENFIKVLASTGLFVNEGDKKFRFLDRQFAEFLGGRRIATLPVHQAKSLVAKDTGYSHGVAGPLREVAAWAATHSPALAGWIVSTDPEVVGISEIADESLRRRALASFLELFRQHRLTDLQLAHDEISLQGLNYPNMESDLRPVLCERGHGLEDVHSCAIELSKAGKLTSLSEELAGIVLARDLPLSAPVHKSG